MKDYKSKPSQNVGFIYPKEGDLIKGSDGQVYTRVKGALRRVTHKLQDIQEDSRKLPASLKRQRLQDAFIATLPKNDSH